MMYNRKFEYVMNVTATNLTETFRMWHDFYCFDIAGVIDVAGIDAETIDVTFPTRPITKISSEPIRAPLLGTRHPGDSQFLYPFMIGKGESVTIEVSALAGGNEFDIVLDGYHRLQDQPAGGCPPAKLVYYYVHDFGTINPGVIERTWNQINTAYDYVCLGAVATPNAVGSGAAFRIVPESWPREMMPDFANGAAIFQNPQATPRRQYWRIPQIFKAGETVSVYATNITAGGLNDVAVAFFGYHVERGLSYAELYEDYIKYR
jgi:hypothetical protein